jgi:hypothetical protein
MAHYAQTFFELLRLPFQNVELIWGIVPLYFGWLLNELTSDKASYRTALQTGFSFLWGGAHWVYLYYHPTDSAVKSRLDSTVSIIVTGFVLLVGLLALVTGLRRRYFPFCAFLGHSRFINYFMIAIFPMQSMELAWTWERVFAIALFAVPCWVLMHFGFKPLRK